MQRGVVRKDIPVRNDRSNYRTRFSVTRAPRLLLKRGNVREISNLIMCADWCAINLQEIVHGVDGAHYAQDRTLTANRILTTPNCSCRRRKSRTIAKRGFYFRHYAKMGFP